MTSFYLLRTITPMHVGTGETNFGVIDNLIERDAITGFPCIHASGLKGAIKQHVNAHIAESGESLSDMLVKIFGSDATVNKATKNGKTQQGESYFHQAFLFAIPVRSDKTPFFLATCPSIITQYSMLRTDMEIKAPDDVAAAFEAFAKLKPDNNEAYCLNNQYERAELGAFEIIVRNYNGQLTAQQCDLIKKHLSQSPYPICLISDEKMMEICNDLNLPVIARNALDDGESKNLWYEQVLQRESLLFFAIKWKDQNHKAKVEDCLLKKPVQIGGNASVGYGFTRISLLA